MPPFARRDQCDARERDRSREPERAGSAARARRASRGSPVKIGVVPSTSADRRGGREVQRVDEADWLKISSAARPDELRRRERAIRNERSRWPVKPQKSAVAAK